MAEGLVFFKVVFDKPFVFVLFGVVLFIFWSFS
jgi:hypothetical protein